MSREATIEAIRAAASKNRLSCEQAHELAQKLNISLREIGTICNDLGIKISACQLGCF